MNDGDGTKCSEESESTDDALAYDDDELLVRRAIQVLPLHFERYTVDNTLPHDYTREVIDVSLELGLPATLGMSITSLASK